MSQRFVQSYAGSRAGSVYLACGCAAALVLGCSPEANKQVKQASGAGSGAPAGPAASGSGGTGNAAAGTNRAGASGASSGGGGASGARSDAGLASVSDSGGRKSNPSLSDDAEVAPGNGNATGPGDWKAGDYPPDINSSDWLEISGLAGQSGLTRQYKVHVPPSYDPKLPTPLVFCIHGLGQDALLFCVTGAAMDKKSDEAGFIMVMPNGYNNSWNAGTCCGDASSMMLDDVALFRAIFAEVGKHLNVDRDRVYATGLSNGGYMSYRLACDAADIFTAVAPGAGGIGTNDIGNGTNPMSDFTACEPSRPVSVLDIHGTDDPLVPYSVQKPSLDHMAQKNGCGTSTSPASQPMSGGDTTCISYDGCPNGTALVGCTIQGGGHCWFGSPDCGTGGGAIGLAIVGNNSGTMKNTDAVWDFFKDKSR